MKDNIELLAPFITELCNRISLSSCVLPMPCKSAFITPLLKKPDLNPADTKSYRPISNLSVLSKLVERIDLVAQQLTSCLSLWNLLPELQSAYRANHSTETVVLRVLSDILCALDRGDFALFDVAESFRGV